MEDYRTLQGQGLAEYEEKRSRFIAVAEFADTEEKALAVLNRVRAENRTARHNVYAYVLREGNRTRYSDDGEPAKTAGMPVLDAIRHAGLTDCVVVVTRYFGGILLGTGGLVRAYSQAAKMALENAPSGVMRVCVRLTVTVEYPLYERVDLLLKEAGARMEEPVFTDRVTLSCVLPQGDEAPILPKLQEWSRGDAQAEVSEGFYTAF
ncbi:MAG: YigZ family protein [Oscillospiraceae bacterium]|nr:YigZ family protein [Oscillospiraceae bacterium]